MHHAPRPGEIYSTVANVCVCWNHNRCGHCQQYLELLWFHFLLSRRHDDDDGRQGENSVHVGISIRG